MRIVFLLFGLIGFLGLGQIASAEPSYCNPATFKNLEVKYNGKKLSNAHIFKIGNLTLAGMAVGNSKVQDVIALAQSYSKVKSTEKYCTWYLNDGNSQAERTFVWRYVPRPTGSNFIAMGNTYMNALGDQLDLADPNFVSCAVDMGYIGMGCDGMKHRGPTVFAMLLAYAGCTPDHAATIATQIWGNNGITTSMRSAIAQRAAEVAASHPQIANELKAVMGQ